MPSARPTPARAALAALAAASVASTPGDARAQQVTIENELDPLSVPAQRPAPRVERLPPEPPGGEFLRPSAGTVEVDLTSYGQRFDLAIPEPLPPGGLRGPPDPPAVLCSTPCALHLRPGRYLLRARAHGGAWQSETVSVPPYATRGRVQAVAPSTNAVGLGLALGGGAVMAGSLVAIFAGASGGYDILAGVVFFAGLGCAVGGVVTVAMNRVFTLSPSNVTVAATDARPRARLHVAPLVGGGALVGATLAF